MEGPFGKLRMEGNEVEELPYLPSEEDSSKPESETPISDMLDKLCPYYMMIGVSYDEFWNGDYTHLKYYVEKYKLETERRNHELWLQGLYNFDALTTVISNALAKKGSTPKKYPEKPYRLTEKTEEEKEEEKKNMVENFRAQLMALDRRFSQKHSKEQGG